MTEVFNLAETVAKRRADGLHCDRACGAIRNGVCVGRARSDPNRPLVFYEDELLMPFYDLKQSDIFETPPDCPFGFSTQS